MSAYPALMLGTPGASACPDAFSSASTLSCPGTRILTVQIAVAGIYLQVGYGLGGNVRWDSEEPLLPILGSLARSCDWVRVRNQVAGQAAQVLLTART